MKRDSRSTASAAQAAERRDDRPSRLTRWLPGVSIARSYRRAWLPRDAMAGATLTAVLVPAGMGYAQAAGLPVVAGLYASFAALLAYAVFGPSRILVLGPDSALVALIAASVASAGRGNAEHALALAGMLAILSGLVSMSIGLLKLGFVTDLLSLPIRYGYLNGITLTVLIGQLPKLLGFGAHGGSLMQQLPALIEGIGAGKTNWTAFAIGAASLAAIAALRRWLPRVPGVLVAVVGATAAVSLLGLAQGKSVAVIGALPRGLPVLVVPNVPPADWLSLLGNAVAIAFVSFADVSLLSRVYALRGGYAVDRNQEFVALGAADIVAGLFQGFSVSASGSRTPVAEAAGAKTQLTGVIAALLVAALLLFAPNALRNTPEAVLAAVVIAASFALLEIGGVRRLYRLRRSEFVQSMVCLAGVALLGVVAGIGLAIGLAVLAFLWRAWRPYSAVLGRIDRVKGYHDVSRHPEARRIPGLVLFRWDAPLFFANAEIFHERVLAAVRHAPTDTQWIIVAAEPVTDVDATAAEMLESLHDELRDAHITLSFAELKGPVKDSLRSYGLIELIGSDHFQPTVGQAVARYLDASGVEWRDWEDA